MGSGPPTSRTSRANPGDLISAIQDLRIKGVSNKDMREIMDDALEKYEVKEWESLLSAAPKALLALGECFDLALLNGIGQTTQNNDQSIEVHLYTNLVECSALGVRAFEEADEKMAKLAKTITDITEHGGIIDKILATIADIKSLRALQSAPSNDTWGSVNKLTKQLSELKQLAHDCRSDSGSVAINFIKSYLEAQKVAKAYDGVKDEELETLAELKTVKANLEAQIKKENGNEDPGLLKAICESLKLRQKRTKGAVPEKVHRHIASLERQQKDKENFIESFVECLGYLELIAICLTNLSGFFCTLYSQVEDMYKENIPAFEESALQKKLTDKKLDAIHKSACEMCCHYTYAETKASVYLRASQECIMPGVKLLDILKRGSDMSRSEVSKTIDQLRDYYEKSLEDIHILAERLPVTKTHAQLKQQIKNRELTSGG